MSSRRLDKPPYKNFRSPSTRAAKPHWRKTKSLRFGKGKAALALMRNGAVLRREFIRGREKWSCNGFRLSLRVAHHLLLNPKITPLKDGLLAGSSQSFVYLARASTPAMRTAVPHDPGFQQDGIS